MTRPPAPLPTETLPTETTLDAPAGLESLVTDLLGRLGEDVSREGLVKTPDRVARSLRFLTSGYELNLGEVLNDALFQSEDAELVMVKDLEFYSLCEHHLLPFFGRVHIAYQPDRTILGLSKFGRVVDMFARRLQVQERLTAEIADALGRSLEPRGVMVVAEASHLCMMMRGVQKQGATTRTLVTRGVFRDDAQLRREVLGQIG